MQGFCYVSAVDEGGAADRCGVKTLWETAGKASKLLVVNWHRVYIQYTSIY